jgi:hypothetical protein
MVNLECQLSTLRGPQTRREGEKVLLTNIIAALPTEAEAISGHSSHAGKWSCLELKGLDNSKLAALCQVLEAHEEAIALEGEDCLLGVTREGCPWVFQLPEKLRGGLAALKPEELVGVAERWVSSEELRYEGWSASDMIPLVQALQRLASHAVASNKELLLWMSL